MKKIIKIEKNIPLANKGSVSWLDDVMTMTPGDSFFVEETVGDRDNKSTLASRMGTTISNYKCKKGIKNWKFAVRNVANGVRCWRVS